MGERRGMGKARYTHRGLMGTDNGKILTAGMVGGLGQRRAMGKWWDNCN